MSWTLTKKVDTFAGAGETTLDLQVRPEEIMNILASFV